MIGHGIVRLRGHRLGVEGARALARVLAPGSPLRVIDLADNDLTAAALMALAPLIDGPLTHLDLSANRLGDAGFAALGRLSNWDHLAGMRLGNNGAGPPGIVALAGGLGKAAQLSVLDLGGGDGEHGNRPGEAGVAAILSLLRAHPELRRLSLEGLSDAAVEMVLAGAAASGLTHLALGRPLPPGLEQRRLALLCRNRNRLPPSAGPHGSWPHSFGADPPESQNQAPAVSVPSTPEQQSCLEVLRALAGDESRLASDAPWVGELRNLLATIARQDRRHHARQERSLRRARVAAAPVGKPSRPEALTSLTPAKNEPVGRHCYVCRESFDQPHHFYERLCDACGSFNLAKRHARANLDGRIALVTGARLKSGFQTALRLLRAGAQVIGTSRFAADAARRYAAEPDYLLWRDRLTLYGVDFLAIRAVETLAQVVAQAYPRLDYLVNNAAQTIYRPPAATAALRALEALPRAELPERLQLCLRTLPGGRLLPASELPPAQTLLQAVSDTVAPADQVNSWVLKLHEVETIEMVTTHVINVVAPFVLSARLRETMARTVAADKQIVQVSAVEGQFYRVNKNARHPHTNMAKAALNMMTRTCAQDYARDGIYMNSVDPGWFSHDAPVAMQQAMVDRGFEVPLDAVDAAARICDPIFSAQTSRGLLLKDYRPVHW